MPSAAICRRKDSWRGGGGMRRGRRWRTTARDFGFRQQMAAMLRSRGNHPDLQDRRSTAGRVLYRSEPVDGTDGGWLRPLVGFGKLFPRSSIIISYIISYNSTKCNKHVSICKGHRLAISCHENAYSGEGEGVPDSLRHPVLQAPRPMGKSRIRQRVAHQQEKPAHRMNRRGKWRNSNHFENGIRGKNTNSFFR